MADVKVTLNKAAVIARLEKQHQKAQFAMSQQALKDCNEYCPKDANGLISSSQTHTDFENGVLKWVTPYARHLYYGVIMVDPKTGKACFPIGDQLYSRKGVKKVKSNREFKFNGKACKLWAEKAASEHKEDWKAIYAKVFKGGGG